jgi:monofunctional biosynthetic peptidoglycan transglycosylase
MLVRAVIASEDARFCLHRGIDFGELKAAIEDARQGNPRGASTITMQVVKNVFLWPSRSYVRKALELPLALLLDFAWPKRRIMEVYLNIAEWGPGIYGAEAAARHYFGKPARLIDQGEAARMAVTLPNPVERDAGEPSAGVERLAGRIETRMRRAVAVGCVR